LLEGLKILGLHDENEPQFAPINDIVCNGYKVSGNAQTRRKGALLQHGTVLLGLDKTLMFSLIKPPQKIRKPGLNKEVAGLEDLLHRPLSFDEAEAAFIRGFKQAFSGSIGQAGRA
jgi:lipoate-protein ligase A